MYYYREDDTLARINSTLNLSDGARIVVSEEFYDRKGTALSKSIQQYSARRAVKRDPGLASVEERVPVYLRVNDFPFYAELHRSTGRSDLK
jgi:hypothetical protein